MQLQALDSVKSQVNIEQIVDNDGVLMTKPVKEMLAALDRARKLEGWHRFAVIYAESGAGKTTCARYFCTLHPETVYVIAPPRHKNNANMPGRIMRAVAAACGLTMGDSGAFSRVCNHFSERDAFIIIDEAHVICDYLTLHYLKQFVERCPKVRVALVGKAPELPKAMEHSRCEEIRRRARIFKELRKPTVAELVESFPVFRQQVIEYLHRITSGNMSHMSMYLEDLLDVCKQNGIPARTLGVQTVTEYGEKHWGIAHVRPETPEVMRRRKG